MKKNRFLLDRRLAHRHEIKTPILFRVWKSGLPEEPAESLNVSERGILFSTNTLLHEGEAVEVLFKMPKEITGEPPLEWRCTGLVVRVQPVNSPKGKLGIGVRFDCYEVSRGAPKDRLVSVALPFA